MEVLGDDDFHALENEKHDAAMEARGWSGDGSGEDDLADFNANEADDYANEGGEDSYLDSAYEEMTDLGD